MVKIYIFFSITIIAVIVIHRKSEKTLNDIVLLDSLLYITCNKLTPFMLHWAYNMKTCAENRNQYLQR